jgi:mono/diheme cytochrome c family protein
MPVFPLSQNLIWRRWVIFLPILILLAACSSDNPQPTGSPTSLPPGDAAHGAELFTQSVNGAPPCSTCHTLDGSTVVGPSMQGYSERAGTRISGKSAEEYTLESITQPASFLAPGFANVMYTNYATAFTPQEVADLIAYLLSL